MNQQDASHIKQLGLDVLKNPNPNMRKAALLELRRFDAPIIAEVLERVLQKDRDKDVRDLAQNLLTQQRLKAAGQPAASKDASKLPSQLMTSEDTTKCTFCGSEVGEALRCPNCGAERTVTGNPVTSKSVVNPDSFILHQAHYDFVFGNSKSLNRSSFLGVGCLTIFLSIFVIVGVFMLGTALSDTYNWFAINQSGIGNTAQLTNRRISSGDDSDTYYVSFRFNHNGKNYLREQKVNWDIYNSAEIGGRVDIVYAPSNPQGAKLTGTNSAPTWMLFFALIWNAIIGLIVFFVIQQYRRVKFLERHGRMLPGEILESSHSTDSDGDLSLKVEYTFRTPDSNKRLSKVERATRNDLKGQRPPAPGTPVVILYYNEQRYMLL
ncbi:MAG: hypothetical protein GC179_04125 [Anaerolineaceae bacterium]|nr:hypothetical protein [Anaerolineaceae bacterium]